MFNIGDLVEAWRCGCSKCLPNGQACACYIPYARFSKDLPLVGKICRVQTLIDRPRFLIEGTSWWFEVDEIRHLEDAAPAVSPLDYRKYFNG